MFNIINNKNGFHNINNGTANEHDSYLEHSYCVNGVERTREHSLMNGVAMPWRRSSSGWWCGILSKSRIENMYAYVSTYVIHYISYYLGILIYVVFVVIVNIVGSAKLLFCFSPYTHSCRILFLLICDHRLQHHRHLHTHKAKRLLHKQHQQQHPLVHTLRRIQCTYKRRMKGEDFGKMVEKNEFCSDSKTTVLIKSYSDYTQICFACA